MSIQTAAEVAGGVTRKLFVRLLAAAALTALPAMPAQAQWLRGESQNFVVYCQCAERVVREQLTRLENFDHLLRLILTADTERSPNKLDVYIVGSSAELREVYPLGNGVAGFYLAGPDGIAMVVDRHAYEDSTEVLFHEYAHHFMHQYASAGYPAWYVEGFAEYLMTTRFTPHAIEVGRPSEDRVPWLIDGFWLPTQRVLFEDRSKFVGDELPRFYAQSWLMAHYFLNSDERSKVLRRYFGAVFRGDDPRTAFETETGMTPLKLEKELRRYIASRFPIQRITLDEGFPTPQISVGPMPRSANALILHAAALRLGIEADSRDKRLAEIRKAAGRHPSDPFSLRVLARAEALLGDVTKADGLLDQLLAASPEDVELLYVKGMLHSRKAETAEDPDVELRKARHWYSRAYKVDDNHYPTLFRYALSLRNDPSFASENTANVLLLAHQLAPQVKHIRAAAAEAMIAKGDYVAARTLLMPLVTDPHGAEAAAWARSVLEGMPITAGSSPRELSAEVNREKPE